MMGFQWEGQGQPVAARALAACLTITLPGHVGDMSHDALAGHRGDRYDGSGQRAGRQEEAMILADQEPCDMRSSEADETDGHDLRRKRLQSLHGWA
jgi:hypothetical protein